MFINDFLFSRNFTNLACINFSSILLSIGRIEIGLYLVTRSLEPPLCNGNTNAYFSFCRKYLSGMTC